MEKIKTSAIIVAAGRGTRMQMDINKQFFELCGKPVVVRTIEEFGLSEQIDEIIVVVNPEDVDFCKLNIIDRFKLNKIKAVVGGGSERQASVYNGVKAISEDTDIVLIHDGARPFLDQRMIADCIEAANEFGVSTVGVPVKDTIKSCDVDGFVDGTFDRSKLWAIQTPQGFKYDIILKAHIKSEIDNYSGTDDTILAKRIGYDVKVVMGSYNNIKITTKEDLVFAEAIIGSLKKS